MVGEDCKYVQPRHDKAISRDDGHVPLRRGRRRALWSRSSRQSSRQALLRPLAAATNAYGNFGSRAEQTCLDKGPPKLLMKLAWLTESALSRMQFKVTTKRTKPSHL